MIDMANAEDFASCHQFLTQLFRPFVLEGNATVTDAQQLYIEAKLFSAAEGPTPAPAAKLDQIVEENDLFCAEKLLDGVGEQAKPRYLFPITSEGIRQMVTFLSEANKLKWHAGFGVLPRTRNGKAYKERIFTLFQDVDCHDEAATQEDVSRCFDKIVDCLNGMGIAPEKVTISNTGKGFHVYLTTEEHLTYDRWMAYQVGLASLFMENQMDADLRLCKDTERVLLLPGTINYKYSDTPRCYLASGTEVCLTQDDMALIPALVSEAKEVAQPASKLVYLADKRNPSGCNECKEVLTDDQVYTISTALKRAYIRGFRDNLILFLVGYMRRNKISEESAYRVVAALVAEDEEKEKRLFTVKRTYSGQVAADELKGWAGIEELIKQAVPDEGVALDIMFELQRGIGRRTASSNNLIATSHIEEQKGYLNSRDKRCIYKFKKKGATIALQDVVLRACIDHVKIVRSNTREVPHYEITFLARPDRLIITRGTLPEIVGRLEHEAIIISKTHMRDAVHAIINTFEETGLAQVVKTIDVDGFFYDDPEDGKSLRETLPPLNCRWDLPEGGVNQETGKHEKLKDGLTVLDSLVSDYYNICADKAATVIKWLTVAPFNYSRKQRGLAPYKFLVLIGVGGSGKSTLANVGHFMWDLPLSAYENSLSSISTAARLGWKMSHWTFPFVVNEAKALFTPEKAELRELIKNAWDGTTVRGRFRHGEYQNELSLAPLILTSNGALEMTQAEIRRFKIVHFLWKDKPSDQQVKDFNRFKSELGKINSLSSYIYDMVRDYPELLEHDDSDVAGAMVLKRLYELAGMPVPYWVALDFLGDEEPMAEFRESQRESIVNCINLYAIERLKMSHGLAEDDNSLESRLQSIVDKNIPSEVVIFERDVVIKKGFLQYLKKQNVEIGSLRVIEEIVGGKFAKACLRKLQINTHVVRVPIKRLLMEDDVPDSIHDFPPAGRSPSPYPVTGPPGNHAEKKQDVSN